MKIIWLLVGAILFIAIPADVVAQSSPSAFILIPDWHAEFLTTDNIAFSGSGNDDGNLIGASLVWTSNLDGFIGSGESFTSSLSAGSHVIKLVATGSGGASGIAFRAITVSDPPSPTFEPTTSPTSEPEPSATPRPTPTVPIGGGSNGSGGEGSGTGGSTGPPSTPTPTPVTVRPTATPVPAPTSTPSPDPTLAAPEPGATPVPAALPAAGNGDAITTLYQALDTGFLAYRAPADMRMGETGEVVVVISKTTIAANLEIRLNEEAIEGGGISGGEEVKISDNMRAILTGINFEIGNQQQDKGFAKDEVQWTWEVKPKETGDHRLRIEVYALVTVEGKDRAIEIAVFKHALQIRVASWDERLQDFGSQNWKWLWTSIFLPIGAWIIRKKSRTA